MSVPEFSRPGDLRQINDTIIINRTDEAAVVRNGATIGGQRSLAGVVAHEMTHGSLRARLGFAADLTYPQALREGYCDFVAQESSLSDAEALALQRRGAAHPALVYWSGRKRVAEAMARPGASVERLFAEWSGG